MLTLLSKPSENDINTHENYMSILSKMMKKNDNKVKTTENNVYTTEYDVKTDKNDIKIAVNNFNNVDKDSTLMESVSIL